VISATYAPSDAASCTQSQKGYDSIGILQGPLATPIALADEARYTEGCPLKMTKKHTHNLSGQSAAKFHRLIAISPILGGARESPV